MKRFVVLYTIGPPAAAIPNGTGSVRIGRSGADWAAAAAEHLVDAGLSLANGASLHTEGRTEPLPATTVGYSILQAESPQHATALLEGHPHLDAPGTSIQLFETTSLRGL